MIIWIVFHIFVIQMKIIGLSGKSGSGKTTLLNAIREKFTPEEVCILSLDNYYKKRTKQRKDGKGYYNFDLMSSFDWDKVVSNLKQLIAGKEVRKKRYTFNNEARASYLTLRPAQIVVIEGIFIFSHPEIWKLLDYSIIIEAPDQLCRQRRLLRDLKDRNYKEEEILHRFNNHFLPAYRDLVEPFKSKVNLVLYNEEELEIARKILLGKVASFL